MTSGQMTLQDTTHSLWRAFDSAWYRQPSPIADGMITAGQCTSPIEVYNAKRPKF